MGHAYIAAEGCEEVVLLGVCSSSDEQLMESLMTLHGEETSVQRIGSKQETPATVPTKAKATRTKAARKSA